MRGLGSGSLVLATMLLLLCAVPPVRASIDPQVADFGDVLAGKTKTVALHLTNHDRVRPLKVALFLQGNSDGFILKTHMLLLGPGETKTARVTFLSDGGGKASDTLVITYLGGRMPEEVLLVANGVREERPVDVHTVASFFERAVEQGTLTGPGSGGSEGRGLEALRDMILEAEGLVAMGDHLEGCGRLRAAARRLRGGERLRGRENARASLVTGESAPELASMIGTVRRSLCGGKGTEVASLEDRD